MAVARIPSVEGGIQPTLLDAKGDLITATANDTPARLAVGANGTVLTADSAEATGLKFATPSGAINFSLLNPGGTALTGASTITVSGISGKAQIMIVVTGASVISTSGTTDLGIRFNGDTGSNYQSSLINLSAPTSGTFDTFGGFSSNIALGSVGAGTDELYAYLFLTGCNTSGVKIHNGAGGGDAGVNNRFRWFGGAYTSASTISSVSIINTTGGGSPNFDAGTIFVYGAA